MRILIAEDDLTSRTMLAGVLKNNGHEVVETVDGAAAWDALQLPGSPRMVILDWMMPEMDGIEVVRRIRCLETDQPPYIILLTAKGEKADIVAGLSAGADDYLSKPFDQGELIARVDVGCRMIEMQAKLHDALDKLAYEASHDHLTGLCNRRATAGILTKEITRELRQHNGLIVAICDIDYFKKINDAYGHQVGDEVLCGVARHLESCLRPFDSLGRIGGEEFLVITPGIKEDNAILLFERLRTSIADTPIETSAGSLSLTISIGVKVWREKETEHDLLTAADSALYEAKNGGRNRVCVIGQLPATGR